MMHRSTNIKFMWNLLWCTDPRTSSLCEIYYDAQIHEHQVYVKFTMMHRSTNIKFTKSVNWFSLQILPERFLILRRTERDIIKNVYWSSCKVHVVTLVRFWRNFNLLSSFFRKILKHKISWKSVQWETSCSMRTDGRTDITKLFL